jgi:hypothetical protein
MGHVEVIQMVKVVGELGVVVGCVEAAWYVDDGDVWWWPFRTRRLTSKKSLVKKKKSKSIE